MIEFPKHLTLPAAAAGFSSSLVSGPQGALSGRRCCANGVLAVLSVKDDSEVMIITKDGKIIRLEASNIRQAGRSTQGVKLVTLEEGDAVAAASVIPEANGEENGNGDNGAQQDLPLQ